MPNQNPNRVLGRAGARELTTAEVEKVSGAGTPCSIKFTHMGNTSDELTDCGPP